MKDLTGRTFGRLHVIERDGTKYSEAAWSCLCDCGNKKTVGSSNLREGRTRSYCVPCCGVHNLMKGSMTQREFIEAIQFVAKHLQPQPK